MAADDKGKREPAPALGRRHNKGDPPPSACAVRKARGVSPPEQKRKGKDVKFSLSPLPVPPPSLPLPTQSIGPSSPPAPDPSPSRLPPPFPLQTVQGILTGAVPTWDWREGLGCYPGFCFPHLLARCAHFGVRAVEEYVRPGYFGSLSKPAVVVGAFADPF